MCCHEVYRWSCINVSKLTFNKEKTSFRLVKMSIWHMAIPGGIREVATLTTLDTIWNFIQADRHVIPAVSGSSF